jgi:hypothetical protein
VIGGFSDIQDADNPYPNSKLGIGQASIYTSPIEKSLHTQRSTTMTTATNSYTQSGPSTLGAKLAQAAYTVVATVLMVEMREALDAKTSGDKTDASFKYGL